jgi:methionyl-tRNA formyltransferase
MDAGLDTGPILDVVRMPIDLRETAATLEHKLSLAGASTLLSYLHRLRDGTAAAAKQQPAVGTTYASKVEKREAEIDWSADAVAIDRQVRAFDPVPGAVTSWDGERVKIWRAHPATKAKLADVPGTVLAIDEAAITIACGDGALEVVELQAAGGRRMSAAMFAAGRRLRAGGRFGSAPGAA